jgi:hypothetical protein
MEPLGAHLPETQKPRKHCKADNYSQNLIPNQRPYRVVLSRSIDDVYFCSFPRMRGCKHAYNSVVSGMVVYHFFPFGRNHFLLMPKLFVGLKDFLVSFIMRDEGLSLLLFFQPSAIHKFPRSRLMRKLFSSSP